MLFKLLAGKHIQKDPQTKKSVMYSAGAIIESSYDLMKLNYGQGSRNKFEKVDKSSIQCVDNNPIIPTNKDTLVTLSPQDITKLMTELSKMDVKLLEKYAQEEEIDLKGNTKKEDILRIIKQSISV